MFKTFTLILFSLGIALIGIYFAYNDPLIEPESYKLPSPPELKGILTPNTKLRNAQYLLHGIISGPESLHFEGNSLYTGLSDGRIVKIENGLVLDQYRLIKESKIKCDGSFDSEPICGRPLGIRKYDSDRLIIADAYNGLYLFNMKDGNSIQLLSSSQEINGKKCTFFNDVEVLNDDNVIFSCSSFKWQRRHAFQALFEQRSDAMIVKYTISTKKMQIIADKLRFANGVQLTKDKTALIFSETGMATIWKISLKPSMKPVKLLENLPGFPDNIRINSRGTYLVGLASHRSASTLSLSDLVASLPFIRKFLLTVLPNSVYIDIIPNIMPGYGFVVEFNEDGKISNTFQDPDGRSVKYISEVIEHEGYLYLGSFRAPYLAKVPKKGF